MTAAPLTITRPCLTAGVRYRSLYQMSTVANVDHSGRFAALMPGAQGLGQIIGPNIAASILGMGLGYSAVFIMCACAALTGMMIYAFMYVRLRKTIPALADAS